MFATWKCFCKICINAKCFVKKNYHNQQCVLKDQFPVFLNIRERKKISDQQTFWHRKLTQWFCLCYSGDSERTSRECLNRYTSNEWSQDLCQYCIYRPDRRSIRGKIVQTVTMVTNTYCVTVFGVNYIIISSVCHKQGE